MVVAVVVLGLLLAAAGTGLVLLGVRVRVLRRRLLVVETALAEVAGGGPERRTPRTLAVAERAVRTVVGTAARVRAQGVGSLVMSSLDDLSRWASEDRGAIARLAREDGTVTILFSDIEGSTSLNDQLGDEDFVRVLIAHDAMVRLHVERRHGHVVKTQGDGFMVVFDRPARAVRAALDIQRSFSQTWSRALRRPTLSVRVGIHCGPVVTRGDDVFGLSVAVAARVAARAAGGQTLVTQAVADELADDTRFALTAEGEADLKGIPGRQPMWSVTRRRKVQ